VKPAKAKAGAAAAAAAAPCSVVNTNKMDSATTVAAARAVGGIFEGAVRVNHARGRANIF
jgi:hypothetical protein